MAVSERRVAANRANAQKSTGPRTEVGKRVVARNRLVHGLRSRSPLLPGEDPQEFEEFSRGVIAELNPNTPLQEQLATEVATLSWKLRRSDQAEVRLLTRNHPADDGIGMLVKMIGSQNASDHKPNSPVWLLDRYTRGLDNRRARALRTLLQLQKREAEGACAEDVHDDEAECAAGAAAAASAEAEAAGRTAEQPFKPIVPPVDSLQIHQTQQDAPVGEGRETAVTPDGNVAPKGASAVRMSAA